MLKKSGIYEKSSVTRTDGTPLPDTAVCFVLRLDNHGGADDTEAARQVVLNYSQNVKDTELEHALLSYFSEGGYAT